MKDNHIIELIESKGIAALSAEELSTISVHTAECPSCLDAFSAMKVSNSLLKERAAVHLEAPPFFHTRVMAAWRERQAANEWSFSNLWRTIGALASSMVAAVAMLAVLTFAIPQTPQVSSLANPYAAEEVILNQTSAPVDDESDAQLLSTIYGGDEETAR
jgi:anti-sigma factor RsiW